MEPVSKTSLPSLSGILIREAFSATGRPFSSKTFAKNSLTALEPISI
jgi:hypothetical protein